MVTLVTRRILTPTATTSPAQAPTLKSTEDYRSVLTNTYSTLNRIFSLKEGDSERLKLQGELDLNGLIKTLEESLGIHSQNNSHSLGSKPILIAGLGKDYSKQWRLIIS